LNSFPWVVNGMLQGRVSFNRVKALLKAPEVSARIVASASTPTHGGGGNGKGDDGGGGGGDGDHGGDDVSVDDSVIKNDVVISVTNADFWHSARADDDDDQHDDDDNDDDDNDDINGGDRNGSVDFESTSHGEVALRDVSLCVRRGELICVRGRVGSGKTSLLLALLGELRSTHSTTTTTTTTKTKTKTTMTSTILTSTSTTTTPQTARAQTHVHGRLAYVAQQPWLAAGSIRANILFNALFEPVKYCYVLFVSALLPDLASMRNGDATAAGERGDRLSGGQRARVALARAVYAAADLYFLDDVLSAVDASVAAHVVRWCVCAALRRRTRVLVTHTHLPMLLSSSAASVRVIDVADGGIVEESTDNTAAGAANDDDVDNIDGNDDHVDAKYDGDDDIDAAMAFDVTSLPLSQRDARLAVGLNWLVRVMRRAHAHINGHGKDGDSGGGDDSSGDGVDDGVGDDDVGGGGDGVGNADGSAHSVEETFVRRIVTAAMTTTTTTSMTMTKPMKTTATHAERMYNNDIDIDDEIADEIDDDDYDDDDDDENDYDGDDDETAVRSETREIGVVRGRVVCEYLRFAGYAAVVAVATSLLLMQSSKNGSDFWLQHWVSAAGTTTPSSASPSPSSLSSSSLLSSSSPSSSSTHFYLTVLACIAAGNSLLTLARAFTFAHAGLLAARGAFDALLRSVV
jgi:ABC-type multidrug transport system ATPase subunit